MGRGILLWLLGIPIPIIILLMLFWHQWGRRSKRLYDRATGAGA